MKEAGFQSKVLPWLRAHYPGYWRKISDKWRSGILDIVGCHKGLFIAIELKNPSLKKAVPTPLQGHEIEEIKTKGQGIAFCANNMKDIEDTLEKEINLNHKYWSVE